MGRALYDGQVRGIHDDARLFSEGSVLQGQGNRSRGSLPVPCLVDMVLHPRIELRRKQFLQALICGYGLVVVYGGLVPDDHIQAFAGCQGGYFGQGGISVLGGEIGRASCRERV